MNLLQAYSGVLQDQGRIRSIDLTNLTLEGKFFSNFILFIQKSICPLKNHLFPPWIEPWKSAFHEIVPYFREKKSFHPVNDFQRKSTPLVRIHTELTSLTSLNNLKSEFLSGLHLVFEFYTMLVKRTVSNCQNLIISSRVSNPPKTGFNWAPA